MDRKAIREQALAELEDERFEAAVEAAKIKLRARRWWHALFPFKIVILRRDYDGE